MILTLKDETQTKNKFATIPDDQPIRLKDLLLIGCVMGSWGIAFVAMKEIIRFAPPFQVGGMRFALGALPLLFMVVWAGRWRKLKPLDFARFALIGLLQTTILFGINFTAIRYVSAGVSSIIVNTYPFFVVLLAHLMIAGDRLNRQKVGGLLLGFGGVLALVLGGKGLGEVALQWPLIMLVAASAWGLSTVLIKKFAFQDMLSLTAFQSLFGAVPLLIIGFGFETQPIEWNGSFVFWLLYLAFVASAFSWLVWSGLLRRYSASRITVFSFLTPIAGVVASVILLGENLSLNMLLGGALVAGGIFVVNVRRKAPSRPAASEYLQPTGETPPQLKPL